MNIAAPGSRMRRCWRKEIRPLVILGCVLFSLRSSLADWNDVPSGSMKPTILEGDRVFVNKLAYDLKAPFTTWHVAEWSQPQRGDIVVFFSPHDGKRLVKRVVGLPGDAIELRNNALVLNGHPVEYTPVAESLLRDVAPLDRATANPAVPARRDFGPYRVAEGCYFMMGDNRDDSFDSRYYGPVERKQIVGGATTVVLSFDRSRYWRPRWQRFLTSLGG